jgi:hypothetical protein
MEDGLAHYSQKPLPDAKPAALRTGALHAPCEARHPHYAPLAQLDRALASGAKGQRFESSRARHPLAPEGSARSDRCACRGHTSITGWPVTS